MALNQAAAKTELRKFMDRNFADYIGDAIDKQDSIDKAIISWKNAFEKCCEFISPASGSLSTALAAFEAAADGMYLDPAGAVFQAACAAFATQLGLGMTGYTATPPAEPFIPIGGDPSNAELSCDFKATQMVEWLKTGVATNIVTSTPESWS
jgi:hypothetical protein